MVSKKVPGVLNSISLHKWFKIPYALGLVALVWISFLVKHQDWQDANYIFRWDFSEYYIYVPDWYIYKGSNFDFIYSLENQELPNQTKLRTTTKGKKVSTMTMGMAIMYSPAFFLAHLYSHFFGLPTHGYTNIYAGFISLTGFLLGWLGLLVLSRCLVLYFDEFVVAITILSLGIGTNLLYYATTEGALSHASGFFLFSLGIWQTILYHKHQRKENGLVLGLVLGLLVLVKPANILFALFPVLYGIRSKDHFFRKLWIKPDPFIAMMLGGLFMVSFQMIHWKSRTGQFIYYAYEEGFDLLNPHLLECLIGFRKGWLIYTPIMIFALIGYFLKEKKLKAFYPAMWVLPAVIFYVLASRENWWYGGSFGFRPMIEWYALLAFPFAIAMKKIRAKLWPLLITLILFIALNVVQTHQYNYRVIHWDSMTWPAYKKVFLKRERPKDLDEYLLK